ncbi:Transformation system protein [hydrothermal vent metagenome]|uniref:Transformation system protein n=1 Tax=hydrothermal vent metagenome TaxID=652676 RepID=A0A1W1EG19_9ZZZZ
MYDIKPLEEEWERYNKKKNRPLYIVIAVLLLIIIVGAFLTYSKSSISSFTSNKSLSSSDIKPSDALIDKPITKLEVNEKRKNSVVSSENNNPMDDSDVFIDVDSDVKKHQNITTTKVLSRENVEAPRVKKKINFNMTDENDPRVHQEVAKRFSVSPNVDDSMFLARIYFKNRNYSKAAKWALETNKLDDTIEESWLIFAKSKSKIGQKNEAIRVLTEYVKKTNSPAAYKLLEQLKI